MAYSYNGIVVWNIKKWGTSTCDNIDEPWKHYAQWKKPVSKDHVLNDPIYEMSRLSKFIEISRFVGKEREMMPMGMEFLLGGDENVLKLWK